MIPLVPPKALVEVTQLDVGEPVVHVPGVDSGGVPPGVMIELIK